MSNQPIVKSPEKADLEAVASFYNVPAPVAKMMFAMIGDTLYPKLQFLLYKGHQKGIQRIELSLPKEVSGEWLCEARVFPNVPQSLLMEIIHLPEDERKAIWNHYSAPTVEWGRASLQNVSNPTMHKWLPEMSRKRAAARALRLFAGIGQTAFEELPEATLTKEDLETESSDKIIRLESVPSTPEVAMPNPDMCSCGHVRKPDHFSDGKDVICVTCMKGSKEVIHDLKPWR